jgi:hypothetical protein
VVRAQIQALPGYTACAAKLDTWSEQLAGVSGAVQRERLRLERLQERHRAKELEVIQRMEEGFRRDEARNQQYLERKRDKEERRMDLDAFREQERRRKATMKLVRFANRHVLVDDKDLAAIRVDFPRPEAPGPRADGSLVETEPVPCGVEEALVPLVLDAWVFTHAFAEVLGARPLSLVQFSTLILSPSCEVILIPPGLPGQRKLHIPCLRLVLSPSRTARTDTWELAGLSWSACAAGFVALQGAP